jgi:hypothetical protein
MYWRCGSSSRAPALQTQSPEFKLQFPLPPTKKKERKREREKKETLEEPKERPETKWNCAD